MDPSEPDKPPLPRAGALDRFAWTLSQRSVIVGLLICLCFVTTVRYACNSRFVSNPQPMEPARASELADRIDPNTCDSETLAIVPGLGDKRAREIIAYRDQFLSTHPGHRAFDRPSDLLKVRGVGLGIMKSMEPFLLFPTAPPTSFP